MAILVTCPKCLTRLQVSDKFAGKEGPCPKCKTKITIPKLEDQVKVHAPEEFSGPKDAKGRAVLKPIEREETKLKPAAVVGIIGGAIATLGVAFLLGRAGPPNVAILTLGLAIVSPALVLGAYAVLRDQELEPYRGRELLVRVAICAVVYALMWGAYAAADLSNRIEEPVLWIFYIVPFLVVGTLTAYAVLDLDYTSAFFHYAFFLVATVILRLIVGLRILPVSQTPIDY